MKRRQGKASVFVTILLVAIIIVLIALVIVQKLWLLEMEAKVERQLDVIESLEENSSEGGSTSTTSSEKKLAEANARIAELELILKQEGKVIDTEQKKGNYNSSYDEYVKLKFPFDGNYYQNVSEAKFYTDISCTDEIKENIRFISSTTDRITTNNGKTVCCLLRDNEEMCYTTDNVMVISEQEMVDNAYHY